MDKDRGFPLSLETVFLFLAILFLAFCCGFLRSLKRYFGRRPSHPPPRRQILVTHVMPRSTTVRLQSESNTSGVFPAEELMSPPPYSAVAVSNILPPSYDEAVKQTAGREVLDHVPKDDNRF